jgi:hypothetical protein
MGLRCEDRLMQKPFEEPLAAIIARDVEQPDVMFLAWLRNQAETALRAHHNNAAAAVPSLLNMIEGRSAREGPLLVWLESVAARSTKTAAWVSASVPKGQNGYATAAVPPSASEAAMTLPQGHFVDASEVEPPTVAAEAIGPLPSGPKARALAAAVPPSIPAEAATPIPKGQSCGASAGTDPETTAGTRVALPKGQSKPALAVVPKHMRPSRVRDEGFDHAMNEHYKFKISLQEGRSIAVGDIGVAALKRMAQNAGKLAWVKGREHYLLTLIASEVAKSAGVRPGSTVAEVLEGSTVGRLIDQSRDISKDIPMIAMPQELEPIDAK